MLSVRNLLPSSRRVHSAAEAVGDAAGHAASRARGATEGHWVTQLARLGYATRGFLYVMIGLLAMEAASGMGGQMTGTKGAVAALVQVPLGRLLLVLVTAGLVAYALWGLLRASVRPKPDASRWHDFSRRFGYLTSTLWYGSLVPFAVALLMGRDADTSNNDRTQMVGHLLQNSWGRPLLLAIAALCVTFAVWQAWEAITAGFRKDFKAGELKPDTYRWVVRIGRVGYAARGTAYAIIGWFVLRGALHRNPDEVKSTEGVLQFLASQPHGALLLGIMAAGLMAFGLYSLTFSKCAAARGL